jgi:hypothetical protein
MCQTRTERGTEVMKQISKRSDPVNKPFYSLGEANHQCLPLCSKGGRLSNKTTDGAIAWHVLFQSASKATLRAASHVGLPDCHLLPTIIGTVRHMYIQQDEAVDCWSLCIFMILDPKQH